MTPRLRAVVQTNPFRRISYHVAVAMTRFTLSSRCRINGSRKASGRIVTATTISSSAASNNAINDGLCHFLQGLSLSVWIRDGLGRRRHQHHFFTMMALVALGLMAAQSVAEAGRPVPRVTVSLQRECGNSQRAVVLINATGPGSAIEVNSGMGLTNSYTCIVQFVSTSNNSKMAFSVHKLDLPHSCQSYVKVWGGNENMNQSVQFCEEINDPRGSKAKVFDHNSLYVKIRTDRADWKYGEHRVGFVMTVTALRPSVLVGDNQKRCLRDEYACRGEEHCIHHKFVCDGFNNCGDGSDEKCLSSVIALASIIVGAILITVLIGVFTYYVRRRRRNRPYDTSRATSTQSVQSDTSLFGTVRETYYRPLYPIGEGRKIKLDELAKDPDEPLLPPHYFVKTRPTHEHLPTHLLLTACGSSSQNGLNKERIKKDASVGASTNDEGAEPKTKRSSLTVLSVSFTPGSSRLGVRRKGGGSRRGSFPPTAKGHQEEALVNAVDVKDLKKLTRRTKAANEQADEAEIENEDESHIVDTVDNQEEFQSNRKHMVLLPQ